ncbi:MAG TPA: NUDIX domain-containing protein [Gammaproteobacteria bacterium]|nr:NUDIX domain-containing protein [Gammaproteobacteria bacterium]
MKYCSQCGHAVEQRVPEGDNLPRHVCPACETIHYHNPKIVTGCLPVWEDRVLLCRRAIEPQYGLWTLPAGFMENGETVEQAALRESWEEARANVHIDGLYTLYSLPHINQVYMLFRAQLQDQNFAAGPESLEVALFTETEIPWQQLAFRTIVETLRHYFADRRSGNFPFHMGTIDRSNRLAAGS